jgi:hypothetical protein
MSLKHVGRMKQSKRKIIVAYRIVPNEPENAVVITTEALMADEHDALMKTVESNAGQSAYEFAEAMARTQLPDGRNMLAAFHTTGKMIKVRSNEVEMVPDRNTSVSLDELNENIARQKGVSVAELALTTTANTKQNKSDETLVEEPVVVQDTQEPLSNEELASKYRSDADRLFKEAKKLREEAEKLSPKKENKK